MPVPNTINDLSTTPASNSPQGSEPALPLMDDYMRTHASFIAFLRDNKLNSSAVSAFILTLLDDADAATARTTLGAASLGANTFTGAQTLPGNAANPLEAVPKQQLDAATRAGIASLSVAVASNAMTGTLAAETLDFRSATLTVGAPVPRTASASASLTVPSGATLGTVNGVQARIVWGWLDNAGTLEPFVANLAGGINLDETTLISTTAISASANSAGVAYSQTARTNVAFRVRGFCDITEATAGTWATAPTLVQGAGGQALAALSSLGYGQTWQNFTASRAANVTYYNTTGRPICVSVNVTMGQTGQASFMVNGVSNIGYVSNVTPSTTVQLSTSCIVPAGGSYSLTSNSSLAFWAELR